MENKTAVELLLEHLEPNILWTDKAKKIAQQAKKMEKKQFVDFFMWFRDNGEKYLGLTIEQFVEEYYKQKYNNHGKNI
jgi:hypothetical protein